MKKNKRKGIPLKEVLNEQLQDPEFKFYFDRWRAVRQVARFVRDARRHAGLTQAELAKRAGTYQTVIARLESGHDSRIPTTDFLERIADALGAKLVISFEQKKAA